MLSEDTIKYIAELFCGDIQGCYTYKTGSKLVGFFNQYFEYNDIYRSGFPSRWAYTYDKIVDLINNQQVDKFLNIILSKNFIMRDLQIDEIQAIVKINENHKVINEKLKQDKYYIAKKNDKFYLVKEDDDLVFKGGGGFALVYKRKSNGLIVKKLKDDYFLDQGIRSRFKREFDITLSLGDVAGIVKVYDFFPDNLTYTMEEAEQTLYKFITENVLSADNKKVCIRQILNIMKVVHDRDIIHRDVNPNNILLFSGMLKISDFGLGKDLNVFASHQTLHTNALGQYSYCAPEQFMMLKEGDKRSDVYSLGRIINFILTGDPSNYHHFLRTVVEKATSQNPSFRYSDAGELLKFVEKSIKYHEDGVKKDELKAKASKGILDIDVENYIYEMNGEQLCLEIIADKGFRTTLLKFMRQSDERALHIIQTVEDSFRDVCKSWESYDPLAELAYSVLIGEFPYIAKELSARLLHFVAFDVNRFNAQHLIENALSRGVEPLIEEILR